MFNLPVLSWGGVYPSSAVDVARSLCLGASASNAFGGCWRCGPQCPGVCAAAAAAAALVGGVRVAIMLLL